MDFGPEQSVHGRPWGHLHGGYFSNPEVARPLVEAVRRVWEKSHPEVIVDLGGGTGFLLSQLRKAGIGDATAMVDLDCSDAQLAIAQGSGMSFIRGSVDGFRRAEVVPEGKKALFAMRSVLHYAGEGGLASLLAHLRAQAEAGECWVHQTACFEQEGDARCLNALYRKMRTRKWYPPVAELRGRLAEAGWRVETALPAPTLRLEAGELGLRYGLTEADLRRIRGEMAAEFSKRQDVFRLTQDGFQADLHYRIFVCRAMP